MSLIYLVIWGFIFIAGVTSVTALVWSIRNDQWRASPQDANIIFALDDNQTRIDTPASVQALSTRGE